jgi:Macrocin-O-methyltransferase (TylF)
MPLDPRSVLVETPVTRWLSALCRGGRWCRERRFRQLGLYAAYAPLMKFNKWFRRRDKFERSLRDASANQRAVSLYLWLMKRCLTDLIYEGPDHHGNFDRDLRENGEEWPQRGHTMIGLKRLDNIQECIEKIIEDGVPGDLIETGVWRGGAVIFMRAVLKAYGVEGRRIWVADSFAGLPDPGPMQHPGDGWWREMPELAVTEAEVRRNFARYDLLDDSVQFLSGWFSDTLSTAPIERLAVLRLDGDMYSSTMDALEALYDKVSPGGFIIIDDYFLEGARQAVHEFLAFQGIAPRIIPIDRLSVFWRKESNVGPIKESLVSGNSACG